MGWTISRRDFIKKSSLIGVGTIVSSQINTFSQTGSGKSRVVIVYDPDCFTNSTDIKKDRIQAMVDNGVMTLTDIFNDIGKAYEALFPKPVTSSTKILMKRNDISGAQRDFSAYDTVLRDAFKNGCGKMLSGKFGVNNVTIRCQGGSAKTDIEKCDFLINCPVCSCHGSDYGVTLSLKNTMTYLNSASVYHSADKKWLYEVSLDPLIKGKQVMSIMNALCGNNRSGPGSSPNIYPKKIVMSKDIVAVDYCTLRIMEKESNPNTNNIKTGDSQLVAAEKAGLGTCTPSKMEVIEIFPPYKTGVIKEYDPLVKQLKVNVNYKNELIEFVLPSGDGSNAVLYIIDSRGSLVWEKQFVTSHGVIWKMQHLNGNRVAKGMYIFTIRQKDMVFRGVLVVTR